MVVETLIAGEIVSKIVLASLLKTIFNFSSFAFAFIRL